MIPSILRQSGARIGLSSQAKGVLKAMTPRGLATAWLKRSNDRKLLLTFDDGPDPMITPHVLKLLKEIGARAVFFVIGEEAARHPGLIREIVAHGHLIGNHSHSHPDFAGLSRQQTREEVIRCQSAVLDACGRPPKLLRPPEGRITLSVLQVAMELDLKTVHWSNEGGEWGVRKDWSGSAIAEALAEELADDQIILLHDDGEKSIEIMSHPRLRAALARFTLNFDILEHI